jgi:hypothetical protein
MSVQIKMPPADELALKILGESYGGPSISVENGLFIVYIWGDAPVGMDILGTGVTIHQALLDVEVQDKIKAAKAAEKKAAKAAKAKKKSKKKVTT